MILLEHTVSGMSLFPLVWNWFVGKPLYAAINIIVQRYKQVSDIACFVQYMVKLLGNWDRESLYLGSEGCEWSCVRTNNTVDRFLFMLTDWRAFLQLTKIITLPFILKKSFLIKCTCADCFLYAWVFQLLQIWKEWEIVLFKADFMAHLCWYGHDCNSFNIELPMTILNINLLCTLSLLLGAGLLMTFSFVLWHRVLLVAFSMHI